MFRAATNVSLILIAPMKAVASWLPELLDLSQQRIPLDPHPQLLSQHVDGLGVVFRPNQHRLPLFAWLL